MVTEATVQSFSDGTRQNPINHRKIAAARADITSRSPTLQHLDPSDIMFRLAKIYDREQLPKPEIIRRIDPAGLGSVEGELTLMRALPRDAPPELRQTHIYRVFLAGLKNTYDLPRPQLAPATGRR
jgi:hypothetical protein